MPWKIQHGRLLNMAFPGLSQRKWGHFQVFAFAFILLAEVLSLSVAVDARTLLSQDRGEAIIWLGYVGDLLKVVVLCVAIFGLVAYRRLLSYLEAFRDYQTSVRWIWLGMQIVLFSALFVISREVFSTKEIHTDSLKSFVWVSLAIGAGIAWLLALAPAVFWRNFVFTEWKLLLVTVAISVTTFALSSATSNLWGPLADTTFAVSSFFLGLSGAEVITVPESKLLGLGNFIVNVAPSCSGYEGIGLITAFTSAYLYLFRNEFSFPRAFLLLPIGIVCIWIFNAARISILIYIGHRWSPDIAVGGFHSQAGWISFIGCALGILWLAHASNFCTTPLNQKDLLESNTESFDINARYSLIPVLVLLGGNLIVNALTADFDYLYPVKAFFLMVSILYVWRKLNLTRFEITYEPILAAIVLSIFWIYVVPSNSEFNTHFEVALSGMSGSVMFIWITIRILSSTLLIPIAEELGFRGYLLSKIDRLPVKLIGPLAPSILAIAASSLVFGMLHKAWIAGTLAGIIFALLRIRNGHIGSSILCHGLTNAILCYVAFSQDMWHLL